MWYLHIHLVCTFVINWLEKPHYNRKVIFYITTDVHPHSEWLFISYALRFTFEKLVSTHSTG